MSLEDNCGKFGRTKMIFFVTLLVVEAYLLQGAEGVVQGSAPIYPAGPGEAHQDSEADCP